MRRIWNWLNGGGSSQMLKHRSHAVRRRPVFGLETLATRRVMAGDVLPIPMESFDQEDLESTYSDTRYPGNFAAEEAVDHRLDHYDAPDSSVHSVCHGVTVLAWARVDGTSRVDADPHAGGAGVDVLIGSTGGDRRIDGAGDDLLIGGTTDYDDHLAAVEVLYSTWRPIPDPSP